MSETDKKGKIGTLILTSLLKDLEVAGLSMG